MHCVNNERLGFSFDVTKIKFAVSFNVSANILNKACISATSSGFNWIG